MSDIATIPLRQARSRLAIIWFPFSGILFLVMVFQTLIGSFDGDVQSAWGWALPNFLPTLALMVSVFASNAMEAKDNQEAVVRTFFFQLAFYLSIFYYIVLFAVILVPAFNQMIGVRPATPEVRLSAMGLSNIFLGPLQSFVVGVIGVLFILNEKKGDNPAPLGQDL